MEKNKPIKRHPAFVALSKDHHFGLLLVWKIKTGLSNAVSPDRIAEYILYFFEKDLQHHFREEEEMVFSKMRAEDPLRRQAEVEHKNIYSLVEGIRQNKNDKALLQQFAIALDEHIRFEERTLFNHLQETWYPEALESLAQQMTKGQEDCDAGWPDHFWVKK
jgi:hypothetical protein